MRVEPLITLGMALGCWAAILATMSRMFDW
jgi:hypothetical protein